MAGLNDDFLLADDSMEPKDAPAVTVQAFKDTPENGEVPELRDDVDLIAVASEELHVAVEDLCVKLRDLDLVQQSIKTNGGMNQTIALEAQVIMPEFINEDRPIGFFTKHPSRTLLTVAMEEITEEKKSVVRRMIDAVVDFIKRIVEKIKSFFNKRKQTSAETNEVKDTPVDPEQALQHINKSKLTSYYAIADSSFVRYVENTFHLSAELHPKISSAEHFGEKEKYVDALVAIVRDCNSMLSSFDEVTEEKKLEKVTEFVTHKGHDIGYAVKVSEKACTAIEKVTQTLEECGKLAETLRNESSSETVEQIKNLQTIIGSLTEMITLLTKYVGYCDDTVQVMKELGTF